MNEARNCLFNELLRIDQNNQRQSLFVLWGNKILPKSLNKKLYSCTHAAF